MASVGSLVLTEKEGRTLKEFSDDELVSKILKEESNSVLVTILIMVARDRKGIVEEYPELFI